MPSTAEAAAIRRATFAAHKDIEQLDAAALQDLQRIYRQAAADLTDRIQSHAGPDGNLALQEMRSALAQVEGRLRDLGQARDAMLEGNLVKAAQLGTRPFTAAAGVEAVVSTPGSMAIANEALTFVRNFIAADGLQLSDRLWRLDRGTRDAIVNTIEQAVIQGHGASRAALDLLATGAGVPADVQAKIKAASAAGISKAVQERMLADQEGGALYNAQRIMRTELNRAHGEAYMLSGDDHPDFGAWQYLLSPAHPKPDICDLLSTQNLYGLGAGCYPDRETLPWPAHPNTLSFVVIKFQDEITDADRQGKETPMQALARLKPEQRVGVLGKKKNQVYKDGDLKQGMIRAPWKAVKIRAGDRKVVTPLPRSPRPAIEKAQRLPVATAALKGLAAKLRFPGITLDQAKSIAAGLQAVLGPYGFRVGTLGWTSKGEDAFGLYTHYRFGHQPGLNDSLRIQKNYAASASTTERRLQAMNDLRNTEQRRQVEALLETERSESSRRDLETRLATIRANKRWAASGDAEDPLFVVAAHESGHALYYSRADVMLTWVEELSRRKVMRIDRIKVSDYATKNDSELFAEVTALIADRRRGEVPEKILQAYDAAVAKVK